jgi:ribonuclease-3
MATRLDVESTARSVEKLTGHVFTNKLLCAEAVQMACPQTPVTFNGIHDLSNNKRLSILGDVVLTKVLCAVWYGTRGIGGITHAPTRWTTLRKELLSNEALGKRGEDLGVHHCVYVAGGMYAKSNKMVATALAAIIGAVYQDAGDEAVTRVIEHLGFLNHRILTVTLQFLYTPI